MQLKSSLTIISGTSTQALELEINTDQVAYENATKKKYIRAPQ